MSRALCNRPSGGKLVAIAVACLLLVLPSAAGAAPLGAKDHGPLSPGLAELARPAVRTQPPALQAVALDLARSGPGSLLREGDRVYATVRFDEGAIARLAELREAGARIVSSSQRNQTVTVAVAPTDLRALAAVPGVQSAWESLAPIAYGVGTAAAGEGPCEGGSVISEGLWQLRVDLAREAFALRGKGITVGVLSDSFDTATEAADASGPVATHAQQDTVSNDLSGPSSSCSEQQLPVHVLDEMQSGGDDEGRAMLQIVHDLAPHAALAFATAFHSEESFAQNIELLAQPVAEGGAGAEVIVDDVGWFEEPFFQDGPIAAAINKVTAEGVSYLSAAGNENLLDAEGNEIASWEAPEFRDSLGCPEAIAKLSGFNGFHCLDFDPEAGTDRTFGMRVKAGATLIVDLQWAEPWNGVNTDLDAFLLNAAGEVLTESAEENVGKAGTQRPVEVVQWENKAATAQVVRLAINRFSGGAAPRLKFILLGGSGVTEVEYPKSNGGDVVGPTISGHAGAASAIATAAVPYDESSEPERYSSHGPVTHYFEPVDGISPAAALPFPETIAKPDVAATDCGATTFFAHRYDGVVWRFCGTSAAAPHAAAVVALLRQANPGASQQQIRDTLLETAAPVGSSPPEAVGAGLVDASAAVEGLPGSVEADDGPSVVLPPQTPVVPDPVVAKPEVLVVPPAAPARPSTFIRKHPAALVRTRSRTARLVFGFGSDQDGVRFLCKIDSAALRPCRSPLARRFGLGKHVVMVSAESPAGLVDPTPAVFRFRVRRLG
jgi:subtilisin family serine protease